MKPHLQVLESLESDYRIQSTCPFCSQQSELLVNKQAFNNWQNGTLAQNAFPSMTLDQREQLISGVCPPCWESTFKPE